MLQNALSHYPLYLLVLLRVVAFIAVSPVFSIKAWPTWAKLGIAAFVAVYTMPEVHGTVPDPFSDPGNYIVAALRETVVGMLLGFIGTMVFTALSFTGHIVDLQIGFSSAVLFDPEGGHSTGLTSSFLSILFTLYFLGLNGLDGLLLAIMHSYHTIPVNAWTIPASIGAFLSHLLTTVMIMGIQVGAPLWVALLLTDVTFALLSRAVPQMNVFVVGQPAKLLVGLSVFAAVIPGIVYLFGSLFQMVFQQLDLVEHWLGG